MKGKSYANSCYPLLFRNNSKKKAVCTCLVEMQFFLNTFDTQLVKSTDEEPKDTEVQL
jgi:hypothetical protein